MEKKTTTRYIITIKELKEKFQIEGKVKSIAWEHYPDSFALETGD